MRPERRAAPGQAGPVGPSIQPGVEAEESHGLMEKFPLAAAGRTDCKATADRETGLLPPEKDCTEWQLRRGRRRQSRKWVKDKLMTRSTQRQRKREINGNS